MFEDLVIYLIRFSGNDSSFASGPYKNRLQSTVYKTLHSVLVYIESNGLMLMELSLHLTL